LTRLIGSAKARELYLTSPILMADEALALGLLSRVVPDEELEAAAQELAMSLAQGPSIALGYIKQNINTAERSTIEAVLDTEAMNHVRCTQTDDHREAAKAFVEKRKAAFSGR
jgi:2-(1,2-epoxy-1,2-dihydrophenyl)acetyl-CoA isomerase